MNCHARRTCPVRHGVMMLVVGALLSACGNNDAPQANKPADSTPAAISTVTAPARADVPMVKACTLITAAEVETATGHKAMDPVEEDSLGRISHCTFGEPGAPMMAGKPLSNVVEISVTTGGNDYYAGPAAQVNAIFEMAAKNAGEVEVVDGLGERAHWTPDSPFDTLRMVKGVYLVEVNIEPDFGGRQAAEQIARAALQKLPE
jgi:hypothetical protein